MNVQKVIYSEKGNPLLVINGAKFFKVSVIKDGKTVSFVMTVVSWILYVAKGRKINSLSGNILTKIIVFCFK
jgi:hypothetical protein